MNWVVTIDGKYEYRIDAVNSQEAMALAHRQFAQEHDNSRPEHGRVTDCKVAE